MTDSQRIARVKSAFTTLWLAFCAVLFGIVVAFCPSRVSAQSAPGVPPYPPDFRDDWMKESDWIWRDRLPRHDPYYRPYQSNHPYSNWPVPFHSSGWGSFLPYHYPMPYGVQDPHRPSNCDPNCRTGQPAAPPTTTVPANDPAAAPSLAPSPDDGRVDPGSRRYVSRWQRSGRGYIHVYGWEWTSNGVLKQKLNKELVDRSELADPMMLEAVPAREVPADPPDDVTNGARDESNVDQKSLFDLLDTNGDGQITPEELRAGLGKTGSGN